MANDRARPLYLRRKREAGELQTPFALMWPQSPVPSYVEIPKTHDDHRPFQQEARIGEMTRRKAWCLRVLIDIHAYRAIKPYIESMSSRDGVPCRKHTYDLPQLTEGDAERDSKSHGARTPQIRGEPAERGWYACEGEG